MGDTIVKFHSPSVRKTLVNFIGSYFKGKVHIKVKQTKLFLNSLSTAH